MVRPSALRVGGVVAPWRRAVPVSIIAAIGFVPMVITTGSRPRCSVRWRQ